MGKINLEASYIIRTELISARDSIEALIMGKERNAKPALSTSRMPRGRNGALSSNASNTNSTASGNGETGIESEANAKNNEANSRHQESEAKSIVASRVLPENSPKKSE